MNAVVAYVVLRARPESETAAIDGLMSAVANILPSYKCPAEIYLAEGLPRTATGKLQRFKLRTRNILL